MRQPPCGETEGPRFGGWLTARWLGLGGAVREPPFEVAEGPGSVAGSPPGGSATIVGAVLLAFDTASPQVSVALLDDDGDVVAELVSAETMRHGEQLAPLIEQVLAEAGVTRLDVTAVAVGAGPGPFTGLRVGLVTARTLGFVLDVPVYGVCSLDALALEAVETGRRRPRPSSSRPTRGARRSTWRRTTPTAAAPAARPSTGPTRVATDAPVVGEGARALPRGLPARRRPGAAQRRLAGAGGRRGARRAARPRAALPAPPRRRGPRRRPSPSRDPASPGPPTPSVLADLEAANLGADAWSPGLVAAGVVGDLPTVDLVGGRGRRGRGRLRRRPASSADIAELQRIARRPGPPAYGPGRASCWPSCVAAARAEGADRLLLEVREDNAGALAFYAGQGSSRSTGAAATTATAPPRSCCGCRWFGGCG